MALTQICDPAVTDSTMEVDPCGHKTNTSMIGLYAPSLAKALLIPWKVLKGLVKGKESATKLGMPPAGYRGPLCAGRDDDPVGGM